MPTPATTAELLDLIQQSGVLGSDHLPDQQRTTVLAHSPAQAVAALVQQGILTKFQAKHLLAGRHRGLRIGAYVVLDQLGQGGMGAVFLAQHATLKRKVAIKVLTASKDPVAVKRFEREARAVAALDHASIVRLFDVANHGEVPYLVMEYVEGCSMEQLLAKSGRLPYSQVAGWAFQIALGLQHAHEQGFVHRDIKPANMMVTANGRAKLLDLGLARSGGAEDQVTEMLDQGAVLGTVDYISPEQALNGICDTRSDIYSLGVTIYVLVSGNLPFTGSFAQKLYAHQMLTAPNLADVVEGVPRELGNVVAKMMAKAPEDRYQIPGEVAAALNPWTHSGSDAQTAVVAHIPRVLQPVRVSPSAMDTPPPIDTGVLVPVVRVKPRPAKTRRVEKPKPPTTQRIWIAAAVVALAVGVYVATRDPGSVANQDLAAIVPTMPVTAQPGVVTGKTATLTVATDSQPGQTYAWTVASAPPGAPAPTFSPNGNAAAKQTVVTFARAGVYTLRVMTTNAAGAATAGEVAVSVAQIAGAIRLTPAVRDVAPGGSVRFATTGSDQFGQPVVATWSATAGQISSTGKFTAPKTTQFVTVTAQGGGQTATATVEVGLVPVGHWQLDDGATTVADAAGTERSGTVVDAIWTVSEKGRTLLHFDGVASNVTFGAGPSLFGQTDFSLTAWVRTTAKTRGVIVQQRDKLGCNGEYQLSVAPNGTVRWMVYGNAAYQFDFGTTAVVNDGQWHQITAVRQGTTGTLYIDGVSAATANGVVRDLDGSISVAVGADIRDNVAYFNGDIADVRIYATALTTSQITSLVARAPQ